jgi:hypothetical protein
MGNLPYRSLAEFNDVCENNNLRAEIQPELILRQGYAKSQDADGVRTILQTTAFFNGPLNKHVLAEHREVPEPFRQLIPDSAVAEFLKRTDQRVFTLMILEGTLPAML